MGDESTPILNNRGCAFRMALILQPYPVDAVGLATQAWASTHNMSTGRGGCAIKRLSEVCMHQERAVSSCACRAPHGALRDHRGQAVSLGAMCFRLERSRPPRIVGGGARQPTRAWPACQLCPGLCGAGAQRHPRGWRRLAIPRHTFICMDARRLLPALDARLAGSDGCPQRAMGSHHPTLVHG